MDQIREYIIKEVDLIKTRIERLSEIYCNPNSYSDENTVKEILEESKRTLKLIISIFIIGREQIPCRDSTDHSKITLIGDFMNDLEKARMSLDSTCNVFELNSKFLIKNCDRMLNIQSDVKRTAGLLESVYSSFEITKDAIVSNNIQALITIDKTFRKQGNIAKHILGLEWARVNYCNNVKTF